ncbi:DUF2897 family protein [Shewanella xiamenensis]|uniref:DUF2897 family protein n=1 Tax=Shewanella xiamenensis TaxID=332186 RepID=UPI0021BF3C5C|nr:DUF2897 family protein [Shewanella xiamenensis]MCT8865369.1 DUF2897 family protein [Shewanella xiamenensis]
MSSLEVWIIIILVVGVIASNLAALKYSAKFKLPQFGQHDKEKQLKSDMTQPRHEADGNETQNPDKSSNQSK